MDNGVYFFTVEDRPSLPFTRGWAIPEKGLENSRQDGT